MITLSISLNDPMDCTQSKNLLKTYFLTLIRRNVIDYRIDWQLITFTLNIVVSTVIRWNQIIRLQFQQESLLRCQKQIQKI